ncbi:zinc finger CCCH domain-containing protein 11A isoform X2 [Melanotaenia boesemani]|uniref:zinc finger CCCH domain-containing protein 11A isoform X2 n=1 Tax=Melanotaenia boesemani TaxID=1250792 RepID=UPI001C05AADF|nr:zinc finger CCCH domain-containing protein 11A isoform X2 [Melanotaenia boesemani]
MTNHGDDCYFYYYSTCTKGDSCPFRHCEAARGSETVCNLWEEGRCFRTVCKFRHMEITKNRKEIPCYWERQPAGCQKPHCAFFHEKPRCIDGIFVPRNKSQTEEQQHEEPAPAPAATMPTTANPQLRGIIKTDSQEPVPSPTHPPVVINPADDDEDEDDQFSEEGEDGKGGPSPRKLPRSGDSLNFGVSTLEEIRLRKALKASMKRAGYPIQSAETPTSGEKENIQSFFRPTFLESGGPPVPEEAGTPRVSVVERLGRKIADSELKCGEGVRLKRSLAQRLGRVVDEEQPSAPPHKTLKPVKERLGLLSAPVGPTSPAENNGVSVQAPEQIRIKTLEEIRQEKAAKSQSQKDAPFEVSPEVTKTNTTKAPKGVKRAVTVKHASISHVKTSEILQAKKKREEEEREQKHSPKRTKLTVEKTSSKSQGELDMARSSPEDTDKGKVRVKTLEEIRREKAARVEAQQPMDAESKKSSDSDENGAKKPRLLRLKKPPAQTGSAAAEQTDEVKEKLLKTPTTAPEISNNVKVKTFEEIMQEKRLRKQEMEEQAKSSAEAETSEKQTSHLKRKLPPKIRLAPINSFPAASSKVPDHKLVAFTSKSAPLANNTLDTAAVAMATVASVPMEQQTEVGSREVPVRNTRISAAQSSVKPTRQAPGSHDGDEPAAENNQMKPPEPAADSKVRPKLNVRPSIVKPAVQVRPGQKKRGAERSAVAAVKPLNSASTVQEESLQESTHKNRQVVSSLNAEAQLTSAVPRSPSTLLDSGSSSSPPREELQTVPVFKQSPGQEAKPAVSIASVREACAVPQSPVLKSSTQSRSRRLSTAASRSSAASSTEAAASTSAVDDFEELINQFTDDHLEEDVDPGIGEDDLLQELSEMIDS